MYMGVHNWGVPTALKADLPRGSQTISTESSGAFRHLLDFTNGAWGSQDGERGGLLVRREDGCRQPGRPIGRGQGLKHGTRGSGRLTPGVGATKKIGVCKKRQLQKKYSISKNTLKRKVL